MKDKSAAGGGGERSGEVSPASSNANWFPPSPSINMKQQPLNCTSTVTGTSSSFLLFYGSIEQILIRTYCSPVLLSTYFHFIFCILEYYKII